MKISKEIKTGAIALLAIGLLVTGVNFLKGKNFFGGDTIYYAYFPNSGGLAPASSVVLNGVPIGKVITIENVHTKNPNKLVRIKFTVSDTKIKIPKGSSLEIGSLDLLTKGLILVYPNDISQGYLKPGGSLMGTVAVDMFSQVKIYADPIKAKLQGMMSKVDNLVTSFSSFWDTTATSELQGSMEELKIAVKRFGNVAEQVEVLISDERLKFSRIMANVESISGNIKLSNDKLTSIIGNTKKITDDFVTADFKNVIGDAQQTIKKLNNMLDDAAKGSGTLGKLIKDDALFNELVETNKDLQSLVTDLEAHPERYIHFSLIGRKSKGLHLTAEEEKELHIILDSTKTSN